jgi:hypothetical protein
MRMLAQAFHDIAPPVSYSIIPPWLIALSTGLILTGLGFVAWWGRKFFRRKLPLQSPQERALESLRRVEQELSVTAPYQFSIRVSDILRQYVLEQFKLPMTRQTSVEFLNAIASSNKFKEAEKSLLTDFLNRCDLIKFARYEATSDDSRLLLEEARRFVKGESLVAA